MTAYYHPETGRVYESLPHRWPTVSGGLALLSEEELAEQGLFPLTDIRPPLTDRQHYGAPTIEQVGDVWTRTWSVINRPVESWEVDAERDRRTDAGIEFKGVRYQTRPMDRENVAGAALLAFMAVSTGAQPGDLYWHGGDTPFTWIAEDDTRVAMDAYDVIDFSKAVAAIKHQYLKAGRALKDFDPIPTNFTDDNWWV